MTVDDDKWHGMDNLHIFLTQSEDKQETISTQQNSYSISMISHLLGTVTAQIVVMVLSQLTTTGSTVTTLLIDCVVTVLPAVNNGNCIVTIQSLCALCT